MIGMTAFQTWLTQWLARHPLKRADAGMEADTYTAQVMARIKQAPMVRAVWPSPNRLWTWLWRPQIGFAVGGALAAIVVGLLVLVQRPVQLAEAPVREARLLARAVEPIPQPLSDDQRQPQPLAEEAPRPAVAPQPRVVVQQEPPTALTDAQWIEQTLTLLSALDEEPPVLLDDDAPDVWLDELQWLDEQAIAAS